jgi:biopolymer transport protein ExbD
MIDIILLILFIFILWNILAAAILYKAKLKEENKQDIIECKWERE